MLAFVIFVATLILVIWRPKGFGIGWSSLSGGVVAMAVGVVGMVLPPLTPAALINWSWIISR